MASFLFCSLQAVCTIMKIGIMILRFLPEEIGNTGDVHFFFSYDCKVGLIDRYFTLFLCPVDSSFLDK